MLATVKPRDYRFYRDHAGYVVGERAKCAIALARAAARLEDAIDLGSARVRWVPDEGCDLSWADEDTLRKVRDGDWDCEGCIIETRCAECGAWSQAASLWGIVGADNDYRRVVEAELALEAFDD